MIGGVRAMLVPDRQNKKDRRRDNHPENHLFPFYQYPAPMPNRRMVLRESEMSCPRC
jgi:hypothetical protein